MVDAPLPIENHPRPLRYLFLDLNAYFASVEQEERPELRGKPVAVVPMVADSTCVIAASYEAKALGVKTGTNVAEARQRCPGIHLLEARPQVYVAYHKAIIEAAETVLPVEEVCSIDEMRFRLLGSESAPAVARELGVRIKKAIRDHVGEQMTCSVGIATNAFLSKLATELQKPDGLVILEAADLPNRLFELKLTDFTGINRRMAARLNGAGIFTAEQLCTASKSELLRAFGSIIGERWWYLLRGIDLPSEKTDRKSLGHSHILPPDLRNDKGCRDVLMRLIQKASARLRQTGLWTSHMTISVSAFEKPWSVDCPLPPTQDTMRMNDELLRVWPSRDFKRPRGVSITFTHLSEQSGFTPSLFEPIVDHSRIDGAIDDINQRFGKNKIFIAGMQRSRNTAPERIAFNKTWLFSEGKGDNEWVDTFRGLREPE